MIIKNAVFLLYSKFRFNLYISLAEEYLSKGVEVKFVVQDVYTFFKVKLHFKNNENVTVSLFRKLSGGKHAEVALLDETIDVISGQYSIETAERLYYGYLHFLRAVFCQGSIVYAGNGCHVQDLAASKASSESGGQCVFSELSNIDGKVFFDVKGSNKGSYFYENYICQKGPLTLDEDEKLKAWKASYKQKKLDFHVVKQARKNNILERLFAFFSEIANAVFHVPSVNYLSHKGLIRLLINKSRVNINTGFSDFIDAKDISRKYLFVPLQVTNDSQILLNSQYDNNSLIEYYLKKAKGFGMELIIKIHPAEQNFEFVKEIQRMSECDGISISNDNTFKLIDGADYIGVNNSTVGLEAIFLDKKVEFIGDTFYTRLLDDSRLFDYLFNYLVEVDFFSGDHSDNILDNIHAKIN